MRSDLPLTPGQRWLLGFTHRFGATAVVVAITTVSVLLSVGLTGFSFVVQGEPLSEAVVYLAVSIGIPLVVAPLASGLVVRLLGSVAAAYAELDRVASTDDLTGLTNRRRFFELVEARVATLDDGDALIVGMLDVDRFKEINDSFGHAIGDAALRAVATRLRGAAGPDAIVARLGGDELACVVPETPGAQEHLLRTLAAACASIAIGEDVRVSASIGFGRVDRATPVDAALAVADAELYAVKSRRATVTRQARTAPAA